MENLSVFDFDKKSLKIDKPIRLIELFAGIGSQAKALQRIGANFEHYRICEFDKYAIKSYNAIHGTDFETSDITKITADDLGIVDTDKYCYIMTYSFPCQDLSLAGKGNGMAKGSGTRSGLLWEVERLLNECEELPQVLLMENVTQVHGKKNKEHFEEWCEFLESKGYNNSWKDLNAKNFGIPQNRNRTFMVSVLGDYTYEFPKEFPLELRLKDMLETEVDEKFYISNAQMEKIVNWKAQQKPFERVLGRESIAQTITARGAGENHSGMIVYSPQNENTTNMQPQIIAGIGEKKSNGGTQWYQRDRIYDDSVATCVTTSSNPYYAIQENDIIDPFIVASRGRNPENPSDRTAGIHTEQRLEPNFSGCSNTLTTVQKDNYVCEPQVLRAERTEYGKAIRKQYEAGEINESIGNMREMQPRTDGISNTITTVQKDNYVAEPVIIQKYGDRGTNQYSIRNYAHTISANPMSDRVQMVVEPKINIVGNYSPSGHDASRIVDTDGLAPTVKENHGTVTALVEPIVCEQRKDEGLRFFKGDYCGALRTINACGEKRVIEPQIIGDQHCGFRIRKLTPKECWRLMGFDDADFEKAAKQNSNSQLYKQAGNSIVVDVLYYIFREML